MKTVALVGLAETTRGAVAQSKADEIWTLNHSYAYVHLPRIDRYFDMHPWWIDARRGFQQKGGRGNQDTGPDTQQTADIFDRQQPLPV